MVALLPTRVTPPSTLVPSSVNCTVPVRVPAPGETAFTVAVKVTGLSKMDGFEDELTAVVVLALLTAWANTAGLVEEVSVVATSALFTVCVNTAEVLVRKLESPLYTTVMAWEVTDKAELV